VRRTRSSCSRASSARVHDVAPWVLLGVVLVTLLVAWWYAEAENRRAILERILGRIEGTLRSGWWRDAVTGTHEGRPFRLQLSTGLGVGRRRNLGEPLVGRRYPIAVQVHLLHAPDVRLRIRPDQGLAALEKSLGLVRDVEIAGGARFDGKFVVEADGATATTPLASKHVRDAVEDLLRGWPLDEVAIRDGKLIVRGRPDTLGARELRSLLHALDVLAHAYDRRPADDLGLAGVFVWVGGRDPSARCPYCHDAIQGSAQLVSCAGCRTVLHRECHEENHGCPILGCGARGAEWTRPPALDKGALADARLSDVSPEVPNDTEDELLELPLDVPSDDEDSAPPTSERA
jgi:hypothetical protein